MVMKWNGLMLFLFLSVPINASQAITLKKALFHEGSSQNTHDARNIEIGNIYLYFDTEPRVDSSVVTRDNQTMHVLFLPHVVISNNTRSAIDSLCARARAHGYKIQFNQKNEPKKTGLEIVMHYPPSHIGITYDHVKTRNLQKGIRIHVYNKRLIHRIRRADKPIITTAALSPPRVFLDCGHGGADCGAVHNGIQEKDVTLAIGLDVARALRSYGVHVFLSREHDEAIPLDMRTSRANKHRADLFVSIHANATKDSSAHGIETYFFDPTHISLQPGCKTHLHTLIQSHNEQRQQERMKKSSKLAATVHKKLLQTVGSSHHINDRQIKMAPFQVLLGSHMPAILIEVGFLTHAQEARFLSETSYQHTLAAGIASGIMQYLNHA